MKPGLERRAGIYRVKNLGRDILDRGYRMYKDLRYEKACHGSEQHTVWSSWNTGWGSAEAWYCLGPYFSNKTAKPPREKEGAGVGGRKSTENQVQAQIHIPRPLPPFLRVCLTHAHPSHLIHIPNNLGRRQKPSPLQGQQFLMLH